MRLFIDPGVAHLGLIVLNDSGEVMGFQYLHTSSDLDLSDRYLIIWDKLNEFYDKYQFDEVIFESYIFRDDATGKSKKGQNTKLTNGVIIGFAMHKRIQWEGWNYNEWNAIWTRVLLHNHNNNITMEIDPEIQVNEHLFDVYRLGYSVTLHKSREKDHVAKKNLAESRRGK